MFWWCFQLSFFDQMGFFSRIKSYGLTPAMGWSVNGIFCFYFSLSFFGLSELKVARQFGSSPLAEPRSVDLA